MHSADLFKNVRNNSALNLIIKISLQKALPPFIQKSRRPENESHLCDTIFRGI